MRRFVLTLSFLLGSACAQTPEPCVLMIGQSHLSGSTNTSWLIPLQTPVYFTGVSVWNHRTQVVEPYTGFNSGGWLNMSANTFGIEVGVAAGLQLALPSFTFVKLARQASPLMMSNEAASLAPSFERLLPQMLGEIAAFESALAAQGKIADWKAIVWAQGESDSWNPAGYQAAFSAFIANLRAATSQNAQVWIAGLEWSHNTPFQVAGLQSVAAAQSAEAAVDPWMFYVHTGTGPSGRLYYLPDRIHRRPESALLEGARVGLAMIGLGGSL